jgi:hypothetical protein
MTSGTLYSVFKEPRPRTARPETAPFFRRETRKNPSSDGPSSLAKSGGPVNPNLAVRAAEISQAHAGKGALGKNQPSQGEREYRFP